jgi:predicted RecB family nuclease
VYRETNQIIYSPSDLCRFMSSPFASWMERYSIEVPDHPYQTDETDPMQGLLQRKGELHEASFVEGFKSQGKNIVVIEGKDVFEKLKRTQEVMKSGADIIYQACLELLPFRGYADFLVKVPGKSLLGDHHYEVWDTKLSKSPKSYFAVQLCCYAEMLDAVQGRHADEIVVVLGNGEICRLALADYQYFYRHLKQQFLAYEASFDVSKMPHPADSREWGRWCGVAEQMLVECDHLNQVAMITRNQIKALEKAGIATATTLAQATVSYIPKIAPGVLDRLKAQARIQKRSAGSDVPAFEIVPPQPGEAKGLALLPPASPMDVFFDIEGFPMVEGGLEYLWGNTHFDARGERQFKDFWAHDSTQEKQAFQAFIQWVHARWQQDPTMHIYHYANYEIAACRRLMGRYGVCENEVDALLRNEVFVDLYKIVRHGILVGEPRYSIKNVEHLYRDKRDTAVGSGGDSVVVYERWRENPDGDTWQTSQILNDIREYNIDDCNSTQELVDWLRAQQCTHGIQYIGKTEVEQKEIPEEITARTQLREALLARADAERISDPKQAEITEVLAWLLEFHRRQDKPVWWRLFDRLGLTADELVDDLDCIAMCERTAREPFKPTPRARQLAYEYRFDTNQEFKAPREGGQMWVLGHDGVKVTLHDFDANAGRLTVKSNEKPPTTVTLIPNDIVHARPIPEAIESVARRYAENQLGECAILDFLQRRPPRISGQVGGSIVDEDSAVPLLDQVIDRVLNLDNSYLCIQGPPGAGKTHTGKHLISELVKRGKRIGIASNSHKAINNLLLGVAEHCQEKGIAAHCCCTKETDAELIVAGVHIIKNADLAANVRPGCVLGTTAWGFARDDMQGALDYLFVDEAGQVAVANLVGMSRSATNLVLEGDQMQLGQPVQGTHPGASGQSVLEYLLQEQATIPKELGIFLGITYRMHPEVNRFISEAIYESRLKTGPENHRQVVHVPEGYDGLLNKEAGIIYVPVEHEGNSQASEEEATVIAGLTQQLLGRTLVDIKGYSHILGWEHILFVAPYNYQVNVLQSALGEQAKVGSVDKFQGQQAPMVFLSLCASDVNEAPRGVSFLLNRNRLNVAISRAQSLAIVVASPKLAFDFNGNLEGMRLVNLFARLVQNYKV